MVEIQEEGDESFAEMFEQSQKVPKKVVRPGEKVVATVVQVGEKRALLDLGGGFDGMIELSELGDPSERRVLSVGERIEAYVLRIDNRVAELGMSAGKGIGAKLALEEAAQTGVPVEGAVTAVNKGGYVVEIAGVRCFCPLGQMDLRRIEDPTTMIGQKLAFKVAEWRGGRDVVLSRRALLEEGQQEKAKETRKRLEVGARFLGEVSSVRDFGAFVDLGGVEGLVHASELGYGRLRPQDVVKVGQEVEVEVLKIEAAPKDGKGERISLSMRSLAVDPFETTLDELPPGTVVRGTVTRIQPYGAFIQLIPGVEGLLHVSAFGKRVGHPSELLTDGQTIAVRVDGVDREARRISLSYVDEAQVAALGGAPLPAPAAAPAPVRAAAARGAPESGPGLKVRKGEKPEPTAAATPQQSGPAKLFILGHQAPQAPTVEALEAEGPAAPARPAELAAPAVGSVLDVTVDRIEPFGLFVVWTGGRGLLPHQETGLERNADLRRSFPVGTVIKAAVVEVRQDGKVRLSKIAAEQAEERAEAAAFMKTVPKLPGKGLGTFGDLLKAKLQK